MNSLLMKSSIIVLLSSLFFIPFYIQAQTTPSTASGAASGTAASVPATPLGGLNATAEIAFPGITKSNKDITTIISTAIRFILGFLGVIFMILIIFGGLLWMTAGGDDNKVKKARDVISNGTIGLIIVLVAYALTIFVIKTIINAVS